jgi:hypothetical protein
VGSQLPQQPAGWSGVPGRNAHEGVLNDDEVLDYALAIREGQHRGLKTLGHTGSMMGFKAYYVRYPDLRFSTWVLCNMGEIVPAELGSQVAELYLSESMEP